MDPFSALSSDGESGLAIVVLGCRLRFEPRQSGALRLVGAAARRAERAAGAYFSRPRAVLVLASGGRAWDGTVEADALASDLEARGVPRANLLRERWSHSTRENASYARELLAPRGIDRVELVTCAFHMPRAKLLFEHMGFDVQTSAATSGERGRFIARLLQSSRERGAMLADARFVRRANKTP